jgi:GNAT superfamily N-acetyltransferase
VIDNIYIDDAYRRQGIASWLIERAFLIFLICVWMGALLPKAFHSLAQSIEKIGVQPAS